MMDLLENYDTQFIQFGHWGIASVDAYDIAFGQIEMHSPFLCPCAKCLQVTLEDPLVTFSLISRYMPDSHNQTHGLWFLVRPSLVDHWWTGGIIRAKYGALRNSGVNLALLWCFTFHSHPHLTGCIRLSGSTCGFCPWCRSDSAS